MHVYRVTWEAHERRGGEPMRHEQCVVAPTAEDAIVTATVYQARNRRLRVVILGVVVAPLGSQAAEYALLKWRAQPWA